MSRKTERNRKRPTRSTRRTKHTQLYLQPYGEWRTIIQASLCKYLFPFFAVRDLRKAVKANIPYYFLHNYLTIGLHYRPEHSGNEFYHYTTRLKKKDCIKIIVNAIQEEAYRITGKKNLITIWRHSGGSGCKPRAFLFLNPETNELILHCKIGNRYRTVEGPEDLVVSTIPNHLFKDCVEALHKYQTTDKPTWWEIETPLINTSKYRKY